MTRRERFRDPRVTRALGEVVRGGNILTRNVVSTDASSELRIANSRVKHGMPDNSCLSRVDRILPRRRRHHRAERGSANVYLNQADLSYRDVYLITGNETGR